MKQVVYEYSSVENDLKEHILKTKTLHPYFSMIMDGSVKSKNYCGIINFNNQNHFLLPKISNDNEQNLDIFTYMFIYAYDLDVKNEDFATSGNLKTDNILEVFIQLFAKNLLKEFQRGIYKNYIIKEENLKVLKGKYLIDENIKYNFNNSKIYCSYDEFSVDNELNRFFLFAIKTLLHYVKDKKILKMCELILDEVTYSHININSLKISFNRLNNRYIKSFEFALMLLQKILPTFSNGEKSFAFLFDMNQLFEKFIGNIFKSIDKTTKLQTQKKFGNLLLKPDIIFQDTIIDTKYKIIKEKNDITTADKYQMFVYGVNFKCKNIMLLYPKHNNHIDIKTLKLGIADNEINLDLKSINLFCDGVCYNRYIEIMRDRVKELMKRYDEWNEVKKDLSKNKKRVSFKQRDIFWINMGQNIGYEVYGKGGEFLRPVIVFKKFSQNTFLGIPLTTVAKDDKFHF